MPIVQSVFASSRDPRLAAQLADHATSAAPAWLWSADGSQILWANAVGAAIFGATSTNDSATRRFEAKHPVAVEVARLAATLPPGGQARLERLRGFGANFGVALTCLCSRFAANGGPSAVFIIATEQVGPPLNLPERARRLFSDRTEPLAVFTPDGALIYANSAAQTQMGGAATLSALGFAERATQALRSGGACQATPDGGAVIERVGSDASTVLVVAFGAQNGDAVAAERTATEQESAFAPTAQPPTSGAPLPQAPRHAAPDEATTERRYPLRFVWQMDADGRFVIGSDEFIELMGPRTTAAFGRLWTDIAAELDLDPQHQVARAVATQETWSGVTVSWPVNEGSERLPVELSGLPVFDRERAFRGYRGFGVCREIARINQLARTRRQRPIGFMAHSEITPEDDEVAAPTQQIAAAAAPEASFAAAPAEAVAPPPRPERSMPTPSAANVVPFRPGASEPKAPSLSPVERKAFRELAQELTARLQGAHEASVADGGAVASAFTASEPAQADHEQAATQQTPMPSAFEPVLLDRIPLGVLIYRTGELLYGNRHFFELSGYQSLDALAAAGGLDALFAEPDAGALAASGGSQSLSVMTATGERRPVEGRLFTLPWGEGSALSLVLTNGEAAERRRAAANALASAENEIRELKTKLESITRSEEELRAATREAQKAAAAKAEFVAKVSHEIRTPLNTITGFAEVIIAERFGPIGNERYREYLKDIHAAGIHLVSLLNDLLDLSKVETGQLNLTFANVSLNELTQQCVGIMQPQASRARIIIRTSLTPGLPQVVADERSLRQIVLNLLSNSIRFTGPGGQVIVSTAFADSGEAVLRVRDTGAGMSEKDVEAALEPFRQTATSGSWGSGGTGLGLPLTKALAEANRAHFSIKSAPNAGTLIEVAFPPGRVVAR
jgi:signal transduction histidine kinase